MSDSAPKRRLPFKPTALRQSKSDTPQVPKADGDGEDDDLALFRRSRHMMSMMTADAERRVKREKEKEEARKRRSETAERGDGSEPGSAQKRRASECEGAEDDSYSTPSRQFSTPSSSSKRHHADSTSPTKFDTPTKAKASWTPTPQPSLGDAITLIDDDDDASTTNPQADGPGKGDTPRWAAGSSRGRATSSSTPAPGSTVEIIDVEDEGEAEEVSALSEEETDPDLQIFINAARERQRLAESQESTASTEHFKVQVESTVPHTLLNDKPLAFKINTTDPLKNLKTTWCSFMQINHVELEADTIFFTWRGRRLYNTTTLRGLGIAMMGNDLLYAGDAGDRRGFSADRRRVVLQAWTEELFEAHLAEEEREGRRRRGELDEEEVQESAPVEEKIKVAMRPKQGDPVKVSVTASSTVGELVEKFRARRSLPTEVKVAIYFDGERLEEDMTLQDADIGDEDQVEVHLS